MRPILAYSNAALPETADEGRIFINISTGEQFTFTKGKWVSDKTPSTPEKVLSGSAIAEPEKAEPSTPKEETVLPTKEEPKATSESQAVTAKAATPKKKTTKKETK